MILKTPFVGRCIEYLDSFSQLYTWWRQGGIIPWVAVGWKAAYLLIFKTVVVAWYWSSPYWASSIYISIYSLLIGWRRGGDTLSW